MFTGIITRTCHVLALEDRPGLRRLTVQLTPELVDHLERGASVAIDGVCLTATEIDDARARVDFDVMQETLSKTTLGNLREGDPVHVERSATFGQEVGGHIVSGHISGRAKVLSITRPENNFVLTLELPQGVRDFVFEKGFIALKGASLTVVDYDHEAGTFSVWLIPETLDVTTFASLEPDDEVNVEVDPQTVAIVETVQRTLARTPSLTP